VSHLTSSSEVTFLVAVWDTDLIIVQYLAPGDSEVGAGTKRAVLDNQSYINTINEFGELLTVRTVTDSAYSKWGDPTETTEDEDNIRAIVNDVTSEEADESEGVLSMNDKIFFFEPTQSNLSNGNRVVHNSVVYEIVQVNTRELGGINFVIEVWGKKT